MNEAMVTGRMSADKKQAAARILDREGLNASQAINLLYDKIIQEGSASFLAATPAQAPQEMWQNAASFVDSLSHKQVSRFDTMSKAEIKMERLAARGLM